MNQQSKEQNFTVKTKLLVGILHINIRQTSKIKIILKQLLP